MATPKIGQTITKEQFDALQNKKIIQVGETISREQLPAGAKIVQGQQQPQPQAGGGILGAAKGVAKFGFDLLGGRSAFQFGRLPTDVAETALSTKEQTALAKSRGGLADLTTQLIRRIRTLPEGQRKEKLKKLALGNLKQMGLSREQEQRLEKQIITPAQAVGRTAEAALTVATARGLGTGAPAREVLKAPLRAGLEAVKRPLLRKAGIGAALGAGFTGARQLAEEGELTPGRVATGAAIGGAIPFVAAGAKALFKKVVQKLPRDLIQKVFKQTPKELAKRDLTDFAIQNKKIGSRDNLFKQSQKIIEKVNAQIQEKLGRKSGTLSTKVVAQQVANEINEAGGKITSKEVLAIVNKLAPQGKGFLSQKTIGVVNANNLRVGIDKTLGDRGFLTSQLPFNKGVLRAFNNALRNAVKNRVPITKALFDTLSKEITLRDTLDRAILKGVGKGVSLTFGDILPAILGGTFGGGIPGAIGGVAVKRFGESAEVITRLGVFLGRLGISAKRIQPILQKLNPADQLALFNAISKLLNVPNQQ